MNHLYKTIFNKRTGKIAVVSEKTSSNCQSQQDSTAKTQNNTSATFETTQHTFLKKKLSIAISILLTSVVSSFSYAAITEVSYTGTEALTPSIQLDGHFNDLIGDPNGIKKGFIVDSDGTPATSDTELKINYVNGSGVSPGFVVSGYATVQGNNTSEAITTNNNSIILEQGDINGGIYSGLINYNKKIENIICKVDSSLCTYGSSIEINNIFNDINLSSSENQLNILSEKDINILSDASIGNIIFKESFGNLISTENTLNGKSDISLGFTMSSNQMDANSNTMQIKKKTTVNDVFVGYAGVNFKYGDLIAADSYGISNSPYYPNSDVRISNGIYANKINANNNLIDGNSTIDTKNIVIGMAELSFEYGNLIAADSINNIVGETSAFASTSNFSMIQENKLNANNNIINLSNQSITDNISAGFSKIIIKVGDSQGAYASNINNTSGIAGTYTSTNLGLRAQNNILNANNNIININKENISNDIVAGHTEVAFLTGDGTSGNAEGNLYFNGYSMYFVEASDMPLNSNNNIIHINSNTSSNNIISGYSSINLSTGNLSAGTRKNSFDNNVESADASVFINLKKSKLSTIKNSINLKGSSIINGDIKTGYIDFNINYGKLTNGDGTDGNATILLDGTSAYATDNTITIVGKHNFKNSESTIYGGYLSYNKNLGYKPEIYDVFTGNTLNYNNRLPINIKEIGNFQNYNFIIDSVIDKPNTPFITANTIILGSHESNMSDTSQGLKSDIRITEIAGDKEIFNNTKYILMQATDTLIENSNGSNLVESVAQQGLSRVYDVDTYVEGNNVVAVIEGGPEDTGVETNPQLDALLLGNLSGLMLLTRSGDLLSDNLFNAISEQNHQRGLTPFIIASGNHTKYDTGTNSHIKSDGGLATIGMSWQNEQLTLGAFAENGWDSYTTFNEFTDVASVSGKGHNRFNGFGLYGHYDFMNGWYADATLRGGRLHTAVETNDLRNVETGERAAYDLSTNYYGANLEGGYSIVFDPKNTVNLKAKYLWAQTGSQDLTVASEQIHFNKLDSHRAQFHIENLNQLTPDLTFISSLGYEYEFTGKAQGHASSYGFFAMDDQSVKGGTGISTLGLRYNPSQYKNLNMDIKATGYIGKREGGMGMLKVDYKF